MAWFCWNCKHSISVDRGRRFDVSVASVQLPKTSENDVESSMFVDRHRLFDVSVARVQPPKTLKTIPKIAFLLPGIHYFI